MKKIIQKIGEFFVKIFGGIKKAEEWLEKNIPEAIQIISRLIAIANDPTVNLTADLVLSLFPKNIQDASDEVKAKAIQWLADAAKILNIGNDCLNKATPLEVILCFIAALKMRSPVDAQGTATKVVSLYLVQQQPDILKLSDTDTALQMHYKSLKIDLAA